MIWSVSNDPPLRGGDGESNEMCWSAIFHASRKFITKAIPESIETIQRKNSVIAQVLDSEGNPREFVLYEGEVLSGNNPILGRMPGSEVVNVLVMAPRS